MCEKAFEENPYTLEEVPDHFKSQELCERVVEEDPELLECVPDHFKTQEMCDGVVGEDPYSLQYVPDWFVTQKQVKTWQKDDDYCNAEETVEWYDNFRKRRALKKQISKELLRVGWHLSRWWDWCIPEDDKKRQKKYRKMMFIQIGEYQIIVLAI